MVADGSMVNLTSRCVTEHLFHMYSEVIWAPLGNRDYNHHHYYEHCMINKNSTLMTIIKFNIRCGSVLAAKSPLVV